MDGDGIIYGQSVTTCLYIAYLSHLDMTTVDSGVLPFSWIIAAWLYPWKKAPELSASLYITISWTEASLKLIRVKHGLSDVSHPFISSMPNNSSSECWDILLIFPAYINAYVKQLYFFEPFSIRTALGWIVNDGWSLISSSLCR